MRWRNGLWVALLSLCISCGGNMAPTNTPPTLTPPPSPTAIPNSRPFLIDAQTSTFGYSAAGQGILSAMKIEGIFKLTGNTMILVPAEDGLYHLDADWLIDVSSATAPNAMLLDTLRTVLEVSQYPNVLFVGRSTQPLSVVDGQSTVNLLGVLTLRGKSNPLTVPLMVRMEAGRLTAEGQITLDLKDFGLNVPTAIMSSTLTFTIMLQAVAQEK
jgi:polyisoprenoid-binding protein YceI